jgi:hypothetical protein
VSTLAEVESAVETLPPQEQRELFDFLASRLESQSVGARVFPDLKALLLAMPDAGEHADFSQFVNIRATWTSREHPPVDRCRSKIRSLLLLEALTHSLPARQ